MHAWWRVVLGSFALLSLSSAARPQQPSLLIPKEDLQAFVDGMFDIQLKRDDAAGAVLVLTQSGSTLLSRGYGMANLRTATPMSAAAIVRSGALTMAVIAVAVMQQVEAGKLTLDADITPSLDLPLATRSGGFITVRELLTHTAGFGGASTSVGTSDLRNYLLSNPPARLFPPGEVHSFSPYGMALAAYLVQRVSGEPFAAYAQRAIFDPLGMTRTTLVQPLPQALVSCASEGYGPSTAGPLPPEMLPPALSLSTTAADMSRFGKMLLGQGSLEGRTVLSPSSVRAILTRQDTGSAQLSPQMPGMGIAFHEVWFNGARMFGIQGDTAAFHSELEIDPQRGLVLFLAYNSSGHPGIPGEPSKLTVFARGELIHGIFDRYQPFHPKVVNLPPSAAQERLATGTWISADEVGLPVTEQHRVRTTVDSSTHSLMADRFVSDRGTVKRWPMLLPDLWQQYPQDRIYAMESHDGLPDRLTLAADPANDLVRAPAQDAASAPSKAVR